MEQVRLHEARSRLVSTLKRQRGAPASSRICWRGIERAHTTTTGHRPPLRNLACSFGSAVGGVRARRAQARAARFVALVVEGELQLLLASFAGGWAAGASACSE